jgi:hypothetical protein
MFPLAYQVLIELPEWTGALAGPIVIAAAVVGIVRLVCRPPSRREERSERARKFTIRHVMILVAVAGLIAALPRGIHIDDMDYGPGWFIISLSGDALSLILTFVSLAGLAALAVGRSRWDNDDQHKLRLES